MTKLFGFLTLNNGLAMNFRKLTHEEVLNTCQILSSSIKNQYLLIISYAKLLELQNSIMYFHQLEIVCDLQNSLEFIPNQRKTIIVDISYLTDSTFFTYFIQIKDFFQVNQKTGFDVLLNSLTLSFRGMQN